MMEGAGTKRTLGVALLASGAAMLVLSGLFWTGTIAIAADARPIIGGALLAAGLIDMAIGVVFVRSA